jgi:hypothetical protein
MACISEIYFLRADQDWDCTGQKGEYSSLFTPLIPSAFSISICTGLFRDALQPQPNRDNGPVCSCSLLLAYDSLLFFDSEWFMGPSIVTHCMSTPLIKYLGRGNMRLQRCYRNSIGPLVETLQRRSFCYAHGHVLHGSVLSGGCLKSMITSSHCLTSVYRNSIVDVLINGKLCVRTQETRKSLRPGLSRCTKNAE